MENEICLELLTYIKSMNTDIVGLRQYLLSVSIANKGLFTLEPRFHLYLLWKAVSLVERLFTCPFEIDRNSYNSGVCM